MIAFERVSLYSPNIIYLLKILTHINRYWHVMNSIFIFFIQLICVCVSHLNSLSNLELHHRQMIKYGKAAVFVLEMLLKSRTKKKQTH